MSDKIKVLVIEPMKPCQVQEISDTLEAIQAVVGGKFEAVFPFDGSTAVVCNRDGKIDGLPFNRPLLDNSGEPYDILCGTFFIAGVCSIRCGRRVSLWAALTSISWSQYPRS